MCHSVECKERRYANFPQYVVIQISLLTALFVVLRTSSKDSELVSEIDSTSILWWLSQLKLAHLLRISYIRSGSNKHRTSNTIQVRSFKTRSCGRGVYRKKSVNCFCPGDNIQFSNQVDILPIVINTNVFGISSYAYTNIKGSER